VRVDRRTTLKWLLASIAASQAGCSREEASKPLLGTAAAIDGVAYGTDPDLSSPVVPWSLTMTDAQLRVAAALCDAILPADDRSPAASALGVPDFIDEWISAPYSRQQEDRELVLDGLEWLEQESVRRFGDGFAVIGRAQQHELLDELNVADDAPAVPAERKAFFRRFRYISVGAYYTTTAGAADVGYIGNVPISGEYPGPGDAALEHLAKVLDELGLELED
jgi:hypothetical protein